MATFSASKLWKVWLQTPLGLADSKFWRHTAWAPQVYRAVRSAEYLKNRVGEAKWTIMYGLKGYLHGPDYRYPEFNSELNFNKRNFRKEKSNRTQSSSENRDESWACVPSPDETISLMMWNPLKPKVKTIKVFGPAFRSVEEHTWPAKVLDSLSDEKLQLRLRTSRLLQNPSQQILTQPVAAPTPISTLAPVIVQPAPEEQKWTFPRKRRDRKASKLGESKSCSLWRAHCCWYCPCLCLIVQKKTQERSVRCLAKASACCCGSALRPEFQSRRHRPLHQRHHQFLFEDCAAANTGLFNRAWEHLQPGQFTYQSRWNQLDGKISIWFATSAKQGDSFKCRSGKLIYQCRSHQAPIYCRGFCGWWKMSQILIRKKSRCSFKLLLKTSENWTYSEAWTKEILGDINPAWRKWLSFFRKE